MRGQYVSLVVRQRTSTNSISVYGYHGKAQQPALKVAIEQTSLWHHLSDVSH